MPSARTISVQKARSSTGSASTLRH
jgi:hypothetical protein